MFEKTSVNKFDKTFFGEKLESLEGNIVNLEIIRRLHTLDKPWTKVKNAIVAHKQCASIDTLDRFSV